MKNIVICRHGQASFDAVSDQLRELTEKGRLDTHSIGSRFIPGVLDKLGLEKLGIEKLGIEKPSALNVQAFVSPYLRTQQSFDSICEGLIEVLPSKPNIKKYDLDCLTPSSIPLDAINDLYSLIDESDADLFLIVTHMPFVSSFLACLIDGDSKTYSAYPMQPASSQFLQTEVLAKGCANVIDSYHPYSLDAL